jgi:uncharacterized protein with HEPN domain
MAREILHVVDDILEAVAGVERAIANKTLEDYKNDWLLRHALQRAVEIISEASRALPEDATSAQPQIRWRAIRAIGNILRHEYHSVSDEIIWKVAHDELPRLKLAVEAIKQSVNAP